MVGDIWVEGLLVREFTGAVVVVVTKGEVYWGWGGVFVDAPLPLGLRDGFRAEEGDALVVD